MKRLAAAACVTLSLVAPSAFAHVVADPRVVVLVPTPKGLEVRINEMSQPGEESIALRRRYDGDRDGKLDDSESADLASFLVARATINLKLLQNGKPLPLKERSRALTGTRLGVGSSDSLSIDIVLEAAPVADKRHVAISVLDSRQDGHAVKLAVLADGVTISRTSLGELGADSTVVTGVALDRGVVEALEFDLPAAPK